MSQNTALSSLRPGERARDALSYASPLLNCKPVTGQVSDEGSAQIHQSEQAGRRSGNGRRQFPQMEELEELCNAQAGKDVMEELEAEPEPA